MEQNTLIIGIIATVLTFALFLVSSRKAFVEMGKSLHHKHPKRGAIKEFESHKHHVKVK